MTQNKQEAVDGEKLREDFPGQLQILYDALSHEMLEERGGSLWCGLCRQDAGEDGLYHAAECPLYQPHMDATLSATPPQPPAADVVEPSLPKWAKFYAPGDSQEDMWILRFFDQDMREMMWTGDDAEAEARAAFARYNPSWNCRLYRLVRTNERPALPTSEDDMKAAIIAAYEAGALAVHENWQEDRDPDFTEAAHDYAADAILALLQPKGPTNED